jgi:hypothetical protein
MSDDKALHYVGTRWTMDEGLAIRRSRLRAALRHILVCIKRVLSWCGWRRFYSIHSQPTGNNYCLRIYDNIITEEDVTNAEGRGE